MGKELEYKLLIDHEETLQLILSDPKINALATSAWQATKMKTIK